MKRKINSANANTIVSAIGLPFFSEKPAFTLAEILITLAIIGLVAALTIPTLVKNQQEKETVTGLKSVFSTLSQAYALAAKENGDPTNWNLVGDYNGTGATNLYNILAPYLKILNKCGLSSNQLCFPPVAYKDFRGVFNGGGTENADTNLFKFQLADGTSVRLRTLSKDCLTVRGTSVQSKNVCASIIVDINGHKKPNIIGKDYFTFYITKYGIFPQGKADESPYSFSDYCAKPGNVAIGCAAWVIYNENTDYLKCGSSLSWAGKTECD